MRKLGVLMLMVFASVGFGQNLIALKINQTDSVQGPAEYSDLELSANVTFTVKGDLSVTESLSLGQGSILIVEGNFSFTGSDAKNGKANVDIQGAMVVAGDLFLSSGALVKQNGNLIVGGDFVQEDGEIELGGDKDELKIYILNPDAHIDVPGGSVVNDPSKVGDVEDFLNDDVGANPSIGPVVNDLIISVSPVIGYQWRTSGVTNEWSTGTNWLGNTAPDRSSNVRIRPSTTNPEIVIGDDVIEVNDLTIKAGAILTLKPGARLTVNGTLTIEEAGGLVLENTAEVDGLASLLTHGEIFGEARISLEFPRDEWYYVSQPIKNAKSDIYGIWNADGTFNTNEGWVNVHRANRWYRIGGGVDIAQLEGLSIKYRVADENDEADHVVTYTGKLNNDMISRPFANRQYYLFGNPYPSALDWQNETGWTRTNIGETIYYRTRINGVMTFVTYNRFNDEGKRAPVIPEGSSEDDLSYIPPLQSVWIASLGDGFVSVDNNARSHVKDGDFLKSSSAGTKSGGAIRVSSVSDGGGDGAVLYFSEKAEDGLDRGDSEKMFNDAVSIPEVYTRAGNKALAINGLPLIEESVRTISLSVRNRVEGEVILQFDLSHYDAEHTPYFEDRQTGAFLSLHRSNSYTYSVKETGDNHDRFALHFYKVTTSVEEPQMDEQEAGNEISIKSVSGKVLVSVGVDMLQNGPGLVEVYSIDGRKVSEVPARSGRTLVMLSNQNGVYIVRAKFGNLIKSERVLVSGN